MSTITLNIPSDRSGIVVNNAFTFTIDFDDTAISPELRHLLTTDPYVAPPDPAIERLLAEEEAIDLASRMEHHEAVATPDRRVHAFNRDINIVRYERRGKWYIEHLRPHSPRDVVARHKVNLAAAVDAAVDLVTPNDGTGYIRYGVAGGSTFDREVKKALGLT